MWCKSKAEGAVGELSRVSLTFSLSAIQSRCTMDPSGAGAAGQFHPQAAAAYQGMACQVNQQVVTAYSTDCDSGGSPCSTVEALVGTPDEGRASALSLDPNTCYVYTSGASKIVGCISEGAGFQIIHMENVGAVQ